MTKEENCEFSEQIEIFAKFLLQNPYETGLILRKNALEYLENENGILNFTDNLDCFKFGLCIADTYRMTSVLIKRINNDIFDIDSLDIETSTLWLSFMIGPAKSFINYLNRNIESEKIDNGGLQRYTTKLKNILNN